MNFSFRYFDLKTIASKKINNCIEDPKEQFGCIMNFIASKMNCSIPWERQFYSQKLALCESKEELQNYIKLKLDIYNLTYDRELSQCLKSKCFEKVAIPNSKMDFDEELLKYYGWFDEFIGKNISILFFAKTQMNVSIQSFKTSL